MAEADACMSYEDVRHTQEEFKISTLEQNRYIRQHVLPKISRISRNTNYDLGTIDKLPAELLSILLQHLSLESIRVFACTNRRAALLAYRHPYYFALRRYHVLTLKACYATKASYFVTLGDLYRCTNESACHICGAFAMHMSLLMAVKLCRPCIAKSPRTLPVSHYTAETKYFLPTAVLDTVPSILAPPQCGYSRYARMYGHYARHARTGTSAAQYIRLYDPDALRAAAVCFYGTDVDLQSAVQQRRKAMTNTAEPWVSPNTWAYRARYNQACRSRISVVIDSPVFDRREHKWQNAHICQACWREFTRFTSQRRERGRRLPPSVCHAKAGLALYDEDSVKRHLAAFGPCHGPKDDRLHVTPVISRLND